MMETANSSYSKKICAVIFSMKVIFPATMALSTPKVHPFQMVAAITRYQVAVFKQVSIPLPVPYWSSMRRQALILNSTILKPI